MLVKQNRFLELLLEQPLNKTVDANANVIYYSEFKQIYSKNTFRNVGIKYVSQGLEYYKVGKTEYKVKDRHYLLSKEFPEVEGFVDSKKLVKGICIDINSNTIADTFSVLSKNSKIDLDEIVSHSNEVPYFFEHVSFAGVSALNERLSQLDQQLTSHNFELPFVDEEWFLETAEELICEQNEKWKSLNRLQSLKNSTRQEVIRRLLIGKEYMDISYINNPDIKSIAEFCCLSEFHFFRSFKDAFTITPYQYMLKKKMELALELITVKKKVITDVALYLNFTDVQAFSNAFKKHFGISPSKVSKG